MTVGSMSAVAALGRHARRAPEQPWLFHRPDVDWRWRSWGQVAAQAGAGPLAVRGELPPRGSAVPYPAYVHPDSLALDLALAAAGFAPLPLPPQPWPPEDEPLAAPPLTELAISPAPESGGGPGAELAALADASAHGGAVVRSGGEPVRLTADALGARARAALAPLGEPPAGDVIVLGAPLFVASERLLFTWAALAGAAVVLEPSAAARAETVRWVRPTLLHGTAAELADVFSAGSPRPRRRWRARFVSGSAPARLAPPFDRVRGVLVFGAEPLPAALEAPWREAGVPVLELPAPLAGAGRAAPGSRDTDRVPGHE